MATAIPLMALAWLGAVGWLLSRAVRQFRHYETIRPDGANVEPSADVTVVVPAHEA